MVTTIDAEEIDRSPRFELLDGAEPLGDPEPHAAANTHIPKMTPMIGFRLPPMARLCADRATRTTECVTYGRLSTGGPWPPF